MPIILVQGVTGEAGIDTTHSLSRSGVNIQYLVELFLFTNTITVNKPGHQGIKSPAKVHNKILYCSGLEVYTRAGGVLGCGGKADDE